MFAIWSYIFSFEAGACLVLLGVYLLVSHYIKKREGQGETTVDADTFVDAQVEVAVRKAGEFVEDLRDVGTGFVDNLQVEELRERYASAFAILAKCDPEMLDGQTKAAVRVFDALRERVDEMNRAFVASESARCDSLFGKLDPSHREACVSDEVSTLVVAGAGSGKTTTIQKKVEYLVRVKGVDPKDILLLSFTNKAADEMTARLGKAMPDAGMAASTFHKFGLEVVKPHLDGDYDISEPQFCVDSVLHALSPDAMTDTQCRGALLYFASCFNAEPEDIGKFGTFGDYIEATRSSDFRTMKGMVGEVGAGKTTFAGEQVKSFEEQEIANWLFLNGIRYEYEKKYDKPVPKECGRMFRVYKPDFYLPDYDIWIEHFGVDENGAPPPFFSEVERKAYVEGMAWKRRLHAQNGTTLVESYSWWHSRGCLTDLLWEALKGKGVVRRGQDPRPIWSKLVASGNQRMLREFARLVATFISLAKSRRLGPDELSVLFERNGLSGMARLRAQRFFEVVRPVYWYYVRALEAAKALDFHDMINKAADIVKETPDSIRAYRYVVIDEFQDISSSRRDLVKAVVDATGAKLFCVGDDWQSIYRFAGSNISIFTDFPRHFGFTRTVKLENTYRNSQELLSVAGDFIMKNPRQIRKSLKSAFHFARPVVCVSYPGATDVSEALLKALNQIAEDCGGREVSVLLLGRHNQESEWAAGVDGMTADRKRERYSWSEHPELKISFLTVHKAKGLEADYVVLLNFKDDLLGFPNRIADDPLLELLLSEHEDILFAEERRVFYVALTRARRRVFILTPESGASVFLADLPDDARPVQTGELADAATCPLCRKGKLVLREGVSKFYGCTNYPRCDYTLPIQASAITKDTPRCVCGGFMAVPCRNPRNGESFLGCTEYNRLPFIRHRPLR